LASLIKNAILGLVNKQLKKGRKIKMVLVVVAKKSLPEQFRKAGKSAQDVACMQSIIERTVLETMVGSPDILRPSQPQPSPTVADVEKAAFASLKKAGIIVTNSAREAIVELIHREIAFAQSWGLDVKHS